MNLTPTGSAGCLAILSSELQLRRVIASAKATVAVARSAVHQHAISLQDDPAPVVEGPYQQSESQSEFQGCPCLLAAVYHCGMGSLLRCYGYGKLNCQGLA